MTTTWLWRHMSIVPELGAIAKWGGHQKRVMAGKMTSMGLDLRHCGFGKPRAIPRQLIKAVGSAGGALGGKDLEQERSFPMGGVEAWFVRSEPLSRKVMNDWLDVMSVTPTRPMKHGGFFFLVQVMAWCRQATSHTWANVDLNVCHYMASLGHNELNCSCLIFASPLILYGRKTLNDDQCGQKSICSIYWCISECLCVIWVYVYGRGIST